MQAVALFLALLLPQTDAPKFGWVKNDQRGVTLKATDGPLQLPLRFKRGTRIRLDVSSDSGISFGVTYQFAPGKWAPAVCRVNKTFKVSTWCVVPNDNSVFAIKDERGLIDIAAGVAGRGSEATTRAAAENKVMIVLYRWACIENCPLKKAATN